MANSNPLKPQLEILLQRSDLSELDAAAMLRALTEPALAPAVAGAVLAALASKGVVAAELRGFARAMRELARHPQLPAGLRAIDVVGTGGDASGSVNISTGTAVLVAACGLPVVKHGNRSISSRCGSADVLEQLGLALPLDEQAAGECLAASGFTFLFAPYFHPAMKSIAAVRAALAVRTVFNILGPLSNPGAPPLHLIGAYDFATAQLMADTLSGMGIERAFVVHGDNGWDEPTPVGPFHIFDVRPGSVSQQQRAPADYGLPTCAPAALAGGDAAHNAAALKAVLRGEQRGAHRDALLLGASLALEIAGEVASPREGVQRALAAIDDGRAAHTLERLMQFGASRRTRS